MKDILRLTALFRPYRRRMLAGIALSCAVILANVALMALSGWFIAAMALAGLGIGTINYFIPASIIRGLAILRTGGRYGERIVSHDATLHLLSTLRVWFYERLEPLAPARLQFRHGGDLLSRIRADIDTLDNFYLLVLVPAAAGVASVVIMFVFLGFFSIGIAMVDLGGLCLVGVLVPWLTLKAGKRPGFRAVELRSSLRSAVADAIRGMGELRVYAVGSRQTLRIAHLGADLLAQQRRRIRIDALSSAFSGLAMHITVWLGIVIAVPLVAGNALGKADLAMIVLFVLASFEAVRALPSAFLNLGEVQAAARRIFEIADMEPAIVDGGTENAPPPDFGLRMDSVWLRYGEEADWALRALDLVVPEGECVGIVGPTGSGKSSILNGVLRFWDYQHGAIEIGGRSVRDYPVDTVRSWCSVVAQKTHLFDSSIRENLLLARPGAGDDEMAEALRQAQLYDEIMTFPEGLDTVVGEMGARLSGGQARRMAIARAFLKDTPILLLDEPTEGLDARSEEAVLRALQSLMKGRTTLLITHRPQALRYVDRVVVLDEGHINAERRLCREPMSSHCLTWWRADGARQI